ncbi:MAG: GlsB/YeaQ/YmgE family stress response membrane protein [Phenylobacterium sp.]
MSGVGIIGAIIIGILAGWLAEKIMKRNHGLLTNLIVGVVGAFLGAFVAGLVGINFGGFVGSLVVSTAGAVLLLFLLSLLKGRSRV